MAAFADSGGSLNRYLDDIGRIPLLTKEQEVELGKKIKAGRLAEQALAASAGTGISAGRRRTLKRAVEDGKEASQKMVEANLRLVVHFAKRYSRKGLPAADLIQYGNLGLIHAVEKFDWEKGFKFSTYASWWIRQAIQRGCEHDAHSVYLPYSVTKIVSSSDRAAAQFEAAEKRSATDAELAEMIEVPLAELRQARLASSQMSLDAPITDSDESGPLLGGVLSDQNAEEPGSRLMQMDATERLSQVLGSLRPLEREAIKQCFGLSGEGAKSAVEAGQQISVAYDVVRRARDRGLSKLRHPCLAANLHDL